MRIFYSWQSDLPNRTTRGFIEESLKRAIRELGEDAALALVPALDRDVQGLPGSPDLSKSLLEKIFHADVFVGDVSVIGKVPTRVTPNPNVLAELGYAAGVLRWERILLVCNTAYGEVEELPFDIRHKRIIKYHDEDTDHDRGQGRKDLSSRLRAELALIAKHDQANVLPLTLRALEAQRVRDTTLARVVHRAKTLTYLNEVMRWKHNKEELDPVVVEVNELAERLRLLPLNCADVFAIALSRAGATGREALYDDVLHATSLDPQMFRSLLAVLEHHSLVIVDESMSDERFLGIRWRALRSGWDAFRDLITFCTSEKLSLADIVVGLRFDLLDQPQF